MPNFQVKPAPTCTLWGMSAPGRASLLGIDFVVGAGFTDKTEILASNIDQPAPSRCLGRVYLDGWRMPNFQVKPAPSRCLGRVYLDGRRMPNFLVKPAPTCTLWGMSDPARASLLGIDFVVGASFTDKTEILASNMDKPAPSRCLGRVYLDGWRMPNFLVKPAPSRCLGRVYLDGRRMPNFLVKPAPTCTLWGMSDPARASLLGIDFVVGAGFTDQTEILASNIDKPAPSRCLGRVYLDGRRMPNFLVKPAPTCTLWGMSAPARASLLGIDFVVGAGFTDQTEILASNIDQPAPSRCLGRVYLDGRPMANSLVKPAPT